MNTIGCEKKGRVLIIDDQPDNIRVLANILQERYDVQAATDGGKALEIASGKYPPDVILLDIVMPEMDGYEVCRRLKADDRTRDIPVIFVTVKDSAEDEEYGFNLGAVDYISKPFQPAVIRVRVKSQIQQQQSKNIIQQHLQDKELLLREVHHRIKNNITFIVSLLDLHAGSTTNLEAQSVLRMARSRVDSMGVLYDKLLSTENYRDIFVKNYLEDLIASIERLFPDYEAITLNKEIDAF
ncbi:MAG: response regulator, partial [Desulfobacterales bacterium]|nr:response regulator [Desulfobacterales bacterium]